MIPVSGEMNYKFTDNYTQRDFSVSKYIKRISLGSKESLKSKEYPWD